MKRHVRYLPVAIFVFEMHMWNVEFLMAFVIRFLFSLCTLLLSLARIATNFFFFYVMLFSVLLSQGSVISSK